MSREVMKASASGAPEAATRAFRNASASVAGPRSLLRTSTHTTWRATAKPGCSSDQPSVRWGAANRAVRNGGAQSTANGPSGAAKGASGMPAI